MKKLVFVALAAFVTVSVSNVFAGSSKAELGLGMPVDTTVVETPDTPVVDDQQTEAMSPTLPTLSTLPHSSSQA